MKVLLIVAGVLFLLTALVLFIAAVAVFLIGRSRRANAAGVAPSPTAAAPHAPPPPPPVPVRAAVPDEPFAAPRAPVHDPDATMMVDTSTSFGALHGISDPLAGRVFPVVPAGVYIGRDRALSQILVEAPSVSKRHVWIGVRDGAVMAIDQSSTNGTFLNTTARRISEVRLTPGDTLIISDDVARFAYRA